MRFVSLLHTEKTMFSRIRRQNETLLKKHTTNS